MGCNPPSHAATLLQTGSILHPPLLWPSGANMQHMKKGQSMSLIELEISTSLRQKRTAFESHLPVIGVARSHLPYFLIKQRDHLSPCKAVHLNKDISQPWAVPAAFKATAQSQF